MPKIFPFRAVMYDVTRVGSLDAVVTQPYDKIDAAMQEEYYRRHPNNIIRITKGKEIRGDDEKRENRYTRAARFFTNWLKEGILRQDAEPALYIYHQIYQTAGGVTKTRKGFTALVGLEPFGRGTIHPHEETHTKPKVDRMNLLRAVRAHTGQVFLLYSDPHNKINALLDIYACRHPDLEAKNELNEVHRVWRLAEPKVIATVAREMDGRDAFIADGHHRYETALAFRDEMRARGVRSGEPESIDRRMVTFVNMDDEGLTILATHRLVSGLPGFSLARFLEQAPRYFVVREFPFEDAASESRARAELLNALRVEGARRPAFGCCGQGANGHVLLVLKDPHVMNEVLDDPRSPEWKQLDVNVLHGICLHRLLGITKEDLAMERYVTYHRHADEVVRAVRGGTGQVGFLLNPVKAGQIKTIVKSGERFPQKTTDFYPKMLSGILIEKLNIAERPARRAGRAKPAAKKKAAKSRPGAKAARRAPKRRASR
jgi:uncharacterized protein (DUF1015 family)